MIVNAWKGWAVIPAPVMLFAAKVIDIKFPLVMLPYENISKKKVPQRHFLPGAANAIFYVIPMCRLRYGYARMSWLRNC